MCDRCELMKRVNPEMVDQIQHFVINEITSSGRPIDIHTVIGIADAAYMCWVAITHKDDPDILTQEQRDAAVDSKDSQLSFLKLLALYLSSTETIPGTTQTKKVQQPS